MPGSLSPPLPQKSNINTVISMWRCDLLEIFALAYSQAFRIVPSFSLKINKLIENTKTGDSVFLSYFEKWGSKAHLRFIDNLPPFELRAGLILSFSG